MADKAYIGALYKKLELTTSVQDVETRNSFIEKIQPELDYPQAMSLLLVCYDLAVPDGDLDWFFEAGQEFIPGFGSDGVDKEVALLAAALLKAEIESSSPYAASICLAIEVAEYGTIRVFSPDPLLPAFAKKKLVEHQTVARSVNKAGTLKPQDLTVKYKNAEDIAQNNTWVTGWGTVKPLIEDSIKRTDAVDKRLVNHFNKLVEYTISLEEQVQAQWFAISAWSKEANRPLLDFSVPEAALRAAVELANIMTSNEGPVAAPALLKMALWEGRKLASLKNFVFAEGCVAGPIAWRKTWAIYDTNDKYLHLTPGLFAIALACENEDDSDWTRTFKRKTNIDIADEISPLEFSLQIYREILAIKIRNSYDD
ncbi:GTPase-associated system all-helical protein GASH [Burkholderia sp. LMU1-1-1.1]|uniref:GTPase-associated system all-helical protein GASH n=1 Tax=Burkholderia sp. LMU1-1-1.1 TaxID=3135266 RepID=UPI00341A45A2